MKPSPITEEMIEQSRAFHGHMCPGLAIGIRAAEVALREIGPHSQDEEVGAVVETDMCGVDAIQFLTGCTFGKGNLIHLDYGKSAFTFYRRSDGNGPSGGNEAGRGRASGPGVAGASGKMGEGVPSWRPRRPKTAACSS